MFIGHGDPAGDGTALKRRRVKPTAGSIPALCTDKEQYYLTSSHALCAEGNYFAVMDISLSILIDVHNPLEAALLRWLTEYDTQDRQQRIKDALLTGYYVNETGVNEYYKKLYEDNLKSMCEKDMLMKLDAIQQEKVALKTDYDKKLASFVKLNEDLQSRVEWLSQEGVRAKDDAVKYYEDKMQKQALLSAMESEAKTKELESLVGRLKAELEDLKVGESVRYKTEIVLLKSQCEDVKKENEYFKGLVNEKDLMLKDAFKNETKERIISLESIIQQKDAELSTLKTCNFVKGMTGEGLLMNFFKEQYPKLVVNHTGKAAHEGDIQLVDVAQDTLIVVESKYKQSIDKNDVDKFCRDVSMVAQKDVSTVCIGGLFVSLLTRNIPGKGDVYFEVIGNVPVMYVGFSNTEEFAVYFKRYADMFFELCKFYKQQGAQKSSIDEVLEEVNFYFNMLVKNKTRIEDFRTNCLSKLNKFVTDIETDNKLILNRVEGMLKKNNCVRYDNVYCCERCGEVFSNKRLHTKHIKTCEA